MFSLGEYAMLGLQVDAGACGLFCALIVCGHILFDDVSATVGLWKSVCFKMTWLL